MTGGFDIDVPEAIAYKFTHEAMATIYEIVIVGHEQEYAQQAAWAAFDEIDRLENELSRFIPSSDIFRINALEPGEQVKVGFAAIECLQIAASVYAESGGAFDPTIGRLLGRNLSERDEPGQLSLGLEMEPEPVGMELIEIDREAFTVTVRERGVKIDLGAIGKGYAVDHVTALLREWGVETALISSGQSSVFAMGAPPDAEAWTVALREPLSQTGTLGSVRLRDRSLSGSGMLLHGRHILDPRTGRPAEGKLATWATAVSAALSDAISTTFMVLPPDEVAAFCERNPGISGLLLVPDAGGPKLLSFGDPEEWRDAAPEAAPDETISGEDDS